VVVCTSTVGETIWCTSNLVQLFVIRDALHATRALRSRSVVASLQDGSELRPLFDRSYL